MPPSPFMNYYYKPPDGGVTTKISGGICEPSQSTQNAIVASGVVSRGNTLPKPCAKGCSTVDNSATCLCSTKNTTASNTTVVSTATAGSFTHINNEYANPYNSNHASSITIAGSHVPRVFASESKSADDESESMRSPVITLPYQYIGSQTVVGGASQRRKSSGGGRILPPRLDLVRETDQENAPPPDSVNDSGCKQVNSIESSLLDSYTETQEVNCLKEKLLESGVVDNRTREILSGISRDVPITIKKTSASSSSKNSLDSVTKDTTTLAFTAALAASATSTAPTTPSEPKDIPSHATPHAPSSNPYDAICEPATTGYREASAHRATSAPADSCFLVTSQRHRTPPSGSTSPRSATPPSPATTPGTPIPQPSSGSTREKPHSTIYDGSGKPILVEYEDIVEVNGNVFHKPLVEKPISAEDHNVYIYFPQSAGGGSQRLFRKVSFALYIVGVLMMVLGAFRDLNIHISIYML